jgi:ATP-binding cassette, subfamily C (CFTR/MRP), member 1
MACVRCLHWELFLVVPPRVCLIGFTWAQPFLISRLISFFEEPETNQTHNICLGLIATAALIYTGISVSPFPSDLCDLTNRMQISTVRYMHQLYRTITMLRGALVGIVYSKTLLLQDGVYDESAALTHMSTDVDRIGLSMMNMNEIWARLIEVAIGVWLLERQLGAVSIVPIIVVVGEFLQACGPPHLLFVH